MNSINANDPEIQNAILAAIKKYGTQEKFGALINIPQSRISQWKNGHGSITPSQWERLYPYVRESLTEGFKPLYFEEEKPVKKRKYGDFEQVASGLAKLATGRQIITGVINVCGVPDEKIRTAIAESNLTQEQKNALILKIFS